MTLITNVKTFPAKRPRGKRVLLLCGFGGAIWQNKRVIARLHKAGYDVTALDFSRDVLGKGDLILLPQLVDEVVAFAEAEARAKPNTILLVGISLGALLALNILRRSKLYDKAVMVTGGDIVKVAHNIYGRSVWPHSYEKLAEAWKSVNIYTDLRLLAGKRMLFVLPVRDKLIDTDDVRAEIRMQNEAGNKIILIERRTLGHIGTIIEETIVFPHRIVRYIDQLS